MDIYREETERRWQIPRTKTKEIHESQRKGGAKYHIVRNLEQF
jgi:hypothetical protein